MQSIPEAFFKHLKGQNCDKAVLRNANGKVWHVKIEGRKLQDGWKEFASDHELHVGDFVVFRHEGDMLFDVMVFDSSTCEREYSSEPLSQVDVEMQNAILDQEGTEKMFSSKLLLFHSFFSGCDIYCIVTSRHMLICEHNFA